MDAILQAAAYILTRRGPAAFNTNAVAERAGVNVASLYQYFPNKEAIVAELQRRHVAETRAEVLEVYVRHRGDRVEDRVRRLVEAAVAAHRVAPELHRVFAEQSPQPTAEPSALLAGGTAELAALGVPLPELSAWMILTVSHAAVHQGILERREDVDSGRLADELVALLLPYVTRRARKGAG